MKNSISKVPTKSDKKDKKDKTDKTDKKDKTDKTHKTNMTSKINKVVKNDKKKIKKVFKAGTGTISCSSSVIERKTCNSKLLSLIIKSIQKPNGCTINTQIGQNGIPFSQNGKCGDLQLNYITSGITGATFMSFVSSDNKQYDFVLKILNQTGQFSDTESELAITKLYSKFNSINPHFVNYYFDFTTSSPTQSIQLLLKNPYGSNKILTPPIQTYKVILIEKFDFDLESFVLKNGWFWKYSE